MRKLGHWGATVGTTLALFSILQASAFADPITTVVIRTGELAYSPSDPTRFLFASADGSASMGWGFPVLLNGLTRGTAAAGPIFSFTDPQAFSDAVDIDSIETFDEFRSDSVIGLGSVTLNAIRYRSSDPSAIWFVEDSFVTNSPPNSLLTRNVIAPVTLTFGGQGFTDGIGFFFRPTNDTSRRRLPVRGGGSRWRAIDGGSIATWR